MSARPDAAWWPLLWDAGVLALAVLGTDRRYRAVNAATCRLLEADAATLQGWSYERVGHPLDLDVELDAFVRLGEGARSAAYTRRYRTARDREFTAAVQVIAGPDDTLLQIITPAVAPVAVAPSNGTLLEQVAAALSHDAQEPVRQLGVSAGLLMERLESLIPAEGRERSLLQGMERNAVRLNRQLRALVRFARLGQVVIDPAPRALRPLIEMAITQVPIPDHVGLEVNVEPTVLVRADRAQLTTAVVELLRNAIAPHAPGRPTRVVIAAQLLDGRLHISIRDDGVGIAAADQPRLFRLFAASGPGSGPGIGLAVVRAIAEGHGGSVLVDSAQGGGTTAVLILPM
jgi:signal transduction histidine kinase